jgi:hypothetical protein
MMGANLALREDRLLGLSHAPRFGLTLSRGASSETPGPTGPTPETVNGLPARVWDYDYAGPEARRHVVDFAAYGAERLLWRDRGLVEAGLRFERTSGSADGARQGVTWQTLSPRVSARLRLTDRGRISLLGGYGEYQHRLLLQDLAFGDPAALQGSVYRWDDGNGNRLLDPGEQGVLVSRVGPGASDGTLAAIDPKLKAPRTREFVAGIEGRLGGDVAVRLTGFDRRERDLVESVNVGVPPSAYTVTYVPDPAGDIAGAQDDQLLPIYSRKPESFGQDRYLLTNPPNHTSHHQGLELRIEKAFGQRFRFLLGGTAYRTEAAGANRGFRVTENDQGVVGEIFDNPNADTYARGRTFFDRSYTLKGAAAYRFPWDMGASLVARYLDGQPFSRFVIAADLPQGPEAIEATPRGQVEGAGAMNAAGQYIVPSGHRFTFTLTVDARLEQGVRVRGHRLGLVAEVFNLLNTRNEVEEYAVGGPHFRDVAAVQPPRTFRFGLRYP